MTGRGGLLDSGRESMLVRGNLTVVWSPIAPRILVTIGLLLLALLACGDETTIEPTPSPPSPASLAIAPDTFLFTALGDTLRLRAEVRDQQGRVMNGAAVAWVSSNAAVAAVAQSGQVRAVAVGTVTITATSGNVSGEARITVRQDVASVAVEPRTASLVVGDTVRLSAEARDANGNTVPESAFLWGSDRAGVADVDSTGLVHGLSTGEATITATSAEVTGSAAVTVAPPNIPPNSAVDEGTSHSLQFAGLHIAHRDIRPTGGHYPAAIAYADYDGDGLVDVFYSSSDGSRDPFPSEVYINDGSGGFTIDAGFFGSITPGGVDPRKALPGDFNGDGRPDIFVLGHGYDHPPFPGEAPYAILSSDNGYVLAEGLDSIIGFHHGGASADIDADGDLDVLVTDTDGPFFLLNDGTGSFRHDTTRVELPPSIGQYTAIYTAELVDVDRDGYVDLLVAGHEDESFSTRILWGGQSGLFSTLRQTILPAIPGHGTVVDIDVADTDGDGDRDIVLNRTSSSYEGYFVQLLEQTGTRSFVDRTDQLFLDNQDSDADWIVWLRVFDIDGDDDPDVLVDEASRALIWKNDGSGKFQHERIPPNPAVDEGTSHALQRPPLKIDHSSVRAGRAGWADAWAYGDFDGDGHPDIFYAPTDGSSRALPAELYLNDGTGSFSIASQFMGGSAPALISATKALPGDYNGDGRIDVFVTGNANWSREPPYILLSTANGYVQGGGLDRYRGYIGASADVDADGDLDVFLMDPPRFLLNDASGSFQRGSTIQWDLLLHGFFLSVELVDVDRDGYVDILVGGHEHDGSVTQIIWGSDTGRYGTSNRTDLPGIAGYGVVLDIDVGDADGDGDKDIVVTRTGDGTETGFYQGYYLQLIENAGNRAFRDVTTSLLSGHRDDRANPVRWVRLHDVDGDGDVDIAVDDYQARDLVWSNDGSGRFRR